MLQFILNILQQFNTRECAIFTLIIIFLLCTLIKKDIRKSFKELFSLFLIKILIIITIYNLLITYLLYYIGIWSFEYFKVSFYWFLGSSIISFFNIKNIDNGISDFKKIIIQSFIITSIVGFISDLYPFSFIIELIILPIIIIIILIIEFGKQKSEINPKYNKTVKVLEWLLIIVSIIILIHIFKSFMNNPHELLNKNTLYCFFLPIIYSILFYPFLYLFRLYMHYETLFVTIKHINSNKFPNDKFKEFSYIKKRRFLFCGLNLPKLIKFSKNMKYITSKYRDIDKLLERFRKIM